MGDDPILAALGRLGAGQAGLQAGQTALRVDIMARIDRMENRLTSMNDDMTVNFAAVEVVRPLHDTTRVEIRSLNESVSNLWRQVKRLESDVREIRGEQPSRAGANVTLTH